MPTPKFLLDGHISPKAAGEAKRRGLNVKAVVGSELREAGDWKVLRAAVEEGRVLVTYNNAHFSVLLADFVREGVDVPGVVFVSRGTIPSSDIGGLVKALVKLAVKIKKGEEDASAGLYLSR